MTSILTSAQVKTIGNEMSNGFFHSSDILNKKAGKRRVDGVLCSLVNAKLVNDAGDKIYIMPDGTIQEYI